MSADGISVANNPDNKLYGINRFTTALARQVSNVTALGQLILDDVITFASGRAQRRAMICAWSALEGSRKLIEARNIGTTDLVY